MPALACAMEELLEWLAESGAESGVDALPDDMLREVLWGFAAEYRPAWAPVCKRWHAVARRTGADPPASVCALAEQGHASLLREWRARRLRAAIRLRALLAHSCARSGSWTMCRWALELYGAGKGEDGASFADIQFTVVGVVDSERITAAADALSFGAAEGGHFDLLRAALQLARRAGPHHETAREFRVLLRAAKRGHTHMWAAWGPVSYPGCRSAKTRCPARSGSGAS